MALLDFQQAYSPGTHPKLMETGVQTPASSAAGSRKECSESHCQDGVAKGQEGS